MMRILLACELYYPSVGGVQEVIRQLAERLAAAGHEVTVATSHIPERTSRYIRGVTVKSFRVSGNSVLGINGEVECYQRFVLAQEYDVLMIKAAQQWTFDALTPVLDFIKKPKIFVPCGFSGMYDPLYAEYFRKMPDWLKKFDHLIFYASDYRDINLARAHGIADISIVPNGADEREFAVPKEVAFRSRHGIAEDAFVVLTVGTVTGLKGHIELAEAFAECSFGNLKPCLLLVGNRLHRNSPPPGFATSLGAWLATAKDMYRVGGAARVVKWLLRPLLEKMGLQEVLQSAGYTQAGSPEVALKSAVAKINAGAGQALWLDLPRSEVIQAYLNSNLFVLASKIEYSPLVLFEAAAAGLPFVSVPVGNAEEIAGWTQGGLICPAPVDDKGFTQVNPAELAREIELLVRQPAVLAALGANGRKAWEERFTWNTIFRAYEKIFEGCIEKAST